MSPEDGLALTAHWVRIGVAHPVWPSPSELSPEVLLRRTAELPDSPADREPGDLLHGAIAWLALNSDLLDVPRLAWHTRRRASAKGMAMLGAICDAVGELEPAAADRLAPVRGAAVPLRHYQPVCRAAWNAWAYDGMGPVGGEPTFRRWGLIHCGWRDLRSLVRPREWILENVWDLRRRVELRALPIGTPGHYAGMTFEQLMIQAFEDWTW